MGKKTFKRAVSLVIALMMILSGTQVFFADTLPAYDEGDIKLSKTATPVEGKENTYKIQLSVQGKDIDTSKDVDVVLVIDNSNSMHDTEDDDKSLAQITKDAANAFIDGVLTESNNGNVRVAVVQYGSYARAYQFTSNDWTDGWSSSLTVDGSEVYVADNVSAKDAVNKATTKFPNNNDGGTNTEGGFLMASKIVDAARNDANSVVIFMTDGMPTYRYSGNSVESDGHWFWGGGGSETSKKELNEAIEAAQSLSNSGEIYTVALLSAFEENSDEAILANYLLSTSPKKYTSDSDIRNIMPQVNKDNRWSAAEAYAVKYYPIFSNVNAEDKMQEIYGTLSGVVNALAKGSVTDIIPENFELTEESRDKLTSQYNASITTDGSGKTTLVFPNISANKAGTILEYDVKAKQGVYGTGFTNDEAYYTFTLFGNEEPSEPKYFPEPIVAINPAAANDDGYSVYEGITLNVGADIGVLVNDKIDTTKLQEGGYTVSDLVVENIGTITTAEGGTVVLAEDGTFEYTPREGFTGLDTFKYKNKVTVSGDGELAKDYESNEANVSIMVIPMGAEMAVYKTEYYLQNADLVSYTLKETITDTGIIDETVYGEWKYYQGYYYNPEVAGTVSTGVVNEDNSLTLKLYYDAIQFNVYYDSNGGIGEMEDKNNPYIYEEEVVVLENDFINNGYVFVGWGYEEQAIQPMSIGEEYSAVYVPGDTFDMPEANVTLYALWQEETPVGEIPYKVRYLDSKTEEKLVEDKVGYGNPEQEITEYAIDIDGYTPVEAEQTFVIDGENILIIFWYEKDAEPIENNVIIVKHYTQSGSNAKVLKQTDVSIPVTTSATIKGENFKITISGHTFVSSTPKEIDVYARVTSESAIQFIFELLYKKDSSGPGPGPGGGGTVIEDQEIPLAELEKVDHFAYIIGYPEGDVRPLNNITREEVAMIFYRLLTDESRTALLSDANQFTDVESGRWSNRAISTLYNADIISGYPDGTFRPSAPITRAEFATIAAKFDDLELGSASKFTDIFGHWAEQYITSSENKGWIKGYPDMTFKPEQDITRAEAMTLINNVLGRKVPAENIHPDAIFWPDISENDWFYEAVMEATNSHDYMYEEDGDELWTGMKANKVWP